MEIDTLRADPVRFGAIEPHGALRESRVMEKDEIKEFLFMVSGAGMPAMENSGTFDRKA